jgi:hypothetical protein
MILKRVVLLVMLTGLSAHAQQEPKKPLPRTPVPPSLALAPAADEQLAAAATAYVGDYVCEFNQRLQVSPNPKFDGYVDVRFGRQVHTLKPVLSSTGALRLEDVRGRWLLVQIPHKSMLFDVLAGRRLVDECVHEKQADHRRTTAAMPRQPGLGIDPLLAAEAAAAASSAPAASAASAR